MAKVRVVMADYEGSDAGLLDLVRSFVPDAAVACPAPGRALLPAVEVPLPAVEVTHAPEIAARAARVAAPKTRGKGRPKKAEVVAGAPAPVKTSEPAELPKFPEGGVSDTIVKVLRARPMTTGALINATGATAPSVYSTLSILRDRGIVETRRDEADGERKNFLKAR